MRRRLAAHTETRHLDAVDQVLDALGRVDNVSKADAGQALEVLRRIRHVTNVGS